MAKVCCQKMAKVYRKKWPKFALKKWPKFAVKTLTVKIGLKIECQKWFNIKPQNYLRRKIAKYSQKLAKTGKNLG